MDAPGIGTLRETGLHAALKAWYAQPGDRLEARVDGYVVDILRGDSIIEIQTHHFGAMRRKLQRLTETRRVRLVYPVALERWIVRLPAGGAAPLGRRKSPRRGRLLDVFAELVAFPDLLAHANFSLEVLLVREEEVRAPAVPARRRWRRDWRVIDRRLVDVVDRVVLAAPADCLALLPTGLAQPFTNRDLAAQLRQPLYLSQKMTYCLRHMGVLEAVGRQGRAVTYVCR